MTGFVTDSTTCRKTGQEAGSAATLNHTSRAVSDCLIARSMHIGSQFMRFLQLRTTMGAP